MNTFLHTHNVNIKCSYHILGTIGLWILSVSVLLLFFLNAHLYGLWIIMNMH